MQTSSLLRHFNQNQNNYHNHPTPSSRILFFVLTNIFLLLISFTITRRSIDVTKKYRIYTLAKNPALFVLSIFYLVSTLLISTYSVFQDAWTIKDWILYTQTCLFTGIAHILYASTYKLGFKSLAGAAFAGFITLIFNQWLFISLSDMSEQHRNKQLQWKLILRIFQGLRTAFVLFHTFQLISQVLVHLFRLHHLKQIILYWTISIISLIVLVIVNIMVFGPFQDVFGFIIGSIMYCIPSIKHSFTYNSRLPAIS